MADQSEQLATLAWIKCTEAMADNAELLAKEIEAGSAHVSGPHALRMFAEGIRLGAKLIGQSGDRTDLSHSPQ